MELHVFMQLGHLEVKYLINLGVEMDKVNKL
jgi:hypothetical protein